MLNTENIFKGKYKLKGVLGKGGMGCVYLAEDMAKKFPDIFSNTKFIELTNELYEINEIV